MQKKFNNNYRKVYDACENALINLGMSAEYKNREKGIISASSSTNIFSWGETIDITITAKGTSTIVRVESESKAQLLDWGKNEKNEENILNEIQEILKR